MESKRAREIAIKRATTLTGLIRNHRESVVAEEARSGQRRVRERLEQSFEQFQLKTGKRAWKRADLYERP